MCHLKNAELETKHQKYKGRVVFRGDIVKDDSGSYAEFTEQWSSALQMTAAKVVDIISRLPGCAGQAADAVSAKTLVKMEDAPKLLKISKIGMSRHLGSSTTTQMANIMVRYGRPSRSSWAKSARSSSSRTVMGKATWENLIEIRLGESFQLGMLIRTTWKGLFLSVYVDDIKLAGEKQNINPMWNVRNKEVDLGEPTSFLDHVYLGCTQRPCEIAKDIVDKYRTMFESRICAGGTEQIHTLRISYFFMVLWYGRSCQEMRGAILWVGKQDESTTLQSINSVHWWPSFQRRRIGIRGRFVKRMLSNCSKMLIFGTYWKPNFLWSVNKLARSITKWTKACDKRLFRLISYIHHTCEYKQYCYVGSTAKQCRLGLFQDSDSAGIQNLHQ